MRVSVYLDDDYAFGIHQDVMIRHSVLKGAHLTVEMQEQILADDALARAKSTAMNYLGSKARSTHEVRQKLSQKGFGAETAERVVDRLEELGYLDDADYARRYAESRFAAKGYGPQRIRQELRRRGVSDQHTQAALEELLETADPLEAAREQAEKRWQRLASETDPRKRRKKLGDFLVRRGFGFDVIRQVTDELERRSA
jgi:regulatory protein